MLLFQSCLRSREEFGPIARSGSHHAACVFVDVRSIFLLREVTSLCN